MEVSIDSYIRRIFIFLSFLILIGALYIAYDYAIQPDPPPVLRDGDNEKVTKIDNRKTSGKNGKHANAKARQAAKKMYEKLKKSIMSCFANNHVPKKWQRC